MKTQDFINGVRFTTENTSNKYSVFYFELDNTERGFYGTLYRDNKPLYYGRIIDYRFQFYADHITHNVKSSFTISKLIKI